MTFTRHVTNAIMPGRGGEGKGERGRERGEGRGVKASRNYMLIRRKLEFRLVECYFWRNAVVSRAN